MADSSLMLTCSTSVIERPVDPTRVAQLTQKLAEYAQRLKEHLPISQPWRDAFCKHCLLGEVLRTGQTTIDNYVQTVKDQITVHSHELNPIMTNAWRVIRDYCRTGGYHNSHKLPPAISAKES